MKTIQEVFNQEFIKFEQMIVDANAHKVGSGGFQIWGQEMELKCIIRIAEAMGTPIVSAEK